MLQQILRDMWIDPELLAELGEDQKQILFCKMREEQLRRWKIWDEQQNWSNKVRGAPKVKMLLGADGEPWTWVMGEHPLDRTIEQILEDEAREKAKKLAEKEAQELRKSVEAEINEILDLNQKQIDQMEADAQELNRLKGKISPTSPSKFDRPEIFSINDQFSKYKPGKIGGIIQTAGINKVSTAVAQWEQKVMEERTSVIFCHLRKKQLEATKEVEDREKDEFVWREQEKKAKEAECQIREIARRAREEHRRTSYCETELASPMEKIPPSSPISSTTTSPTSPMQSLSIVGAPVAASRPPNRTAIIEWFRGSELNRRAGVNDHNAPETWFHGLISRQEAEQILSDKPVGSFLVRLSERIWGYAITYRDSERFKHYLIDASNDHYQFLGADQIHHSTLGSLVKYYQNQPITSVGGELLRSPCPPECTPEVFRDPCLVASR